MSSRANLLIFIPDQLRADCVGCFGNPLAHTPNIDALAARGTRFSQAFGQHSVCSPSRVSFLTGWYPHVRGHRTLDHLLQAHEPNLLRTLKDAGYHVAHVGLRGDTFAKGVTKGSTTRFGFAIKPTLTFKPSPYPPDHYFSRAFYHGRRDGRDEGLPTLDMDEACTITAEEWLADGMPEPWVLYVPLIFPHCPFVVEEPWYSLHDRTEMPAPAPLPQGEMPRFMRMIRDRYGTGRLGPDDWAELIATYYGMVSRVDAQLGRIMQAVDRSGARSRTATFFFTDHGEYLGDYGLVEKWCAGQHDSLLHNPLIISTPDGPQGHVATGLVELLDIVPTIYELADVKPRYTHFGRSLNPAIAGADAGRDAVFSEGGHLPEDAERFEAVGFPYDLKTQIGLDDPLSDSKVVTIRTEDWTYSHRPYESDELYDRRADPQQLVNLSGRAEHAATESALRDRILRWLVETNDVVPWETDPRFDFSGAEKARE